MHICIHAYYACMHICMSETTTSSAAAATTTTTAADSAETTTTTTTITIESKTESYCGINADTVFAAHGLSVNTLRR